MNAKDILKTLNNMGFVYTCLGLSKKAIEIYKQTKLIAEEIRKVISEQTTAPEIDINNKGVFMSAKYDISLFQGETLNLHLLYLDEKL